MHLVFCPFLWNENIFMDVTIGQNTKISRWACFPCTSLFSWLCVYTAGVWGSLVFQAFIDRQTEDSCTCYSPVLSQNDSKGEKMFSVIKLSNFASFSSARDKVKHPTQPFSLTSTGGQWKLVIFPSWTWMEITIKSSFGVLLVEWHQREVTKENILQTGEEFWPIIATFCSSKWRW